jgi:pyruvate dehydrogenase E2 component (dihydrolipoamide acetyltransferase)
VDILLPRVSDTMQEGVVARWLVASGQQVTKGDVIAEVETEKATVELVAEESGTVALVAQPGVAVPTGGLLARIDSGREQASVVPAQTVVVPKVSAGVVRERELLSRRVETTTGRRSTTRVRATPLARRMAKYSGVDLEREFGSSRAGAPSEVFAADVVDLLAGGLRGKPSDRTMDTRPAASVTHIEVAGRRERRDLDTSLTTPYLWFTSVADLSRLAPFWESPRRTGTGGERVEVIDILAMAAARALSSHPRMNAVWTEGRVLLRAGVHVGIYATAETGPSGVVVIAQAQKLDLGAIANRRAELYRTTDEPRESLNAISATIEVVDVSHLMITNCGWQPQPPATSLLILGAGVPSVASEHSPGQWRRSLSLTVDGRALPGLLGAHLLNAVRILLENPGSLLGDMEGKGVSHLK